MLAAAVVAQGFQHRGLVADLDHARVQAGLVGCFKVHVLVDQHLAGERAGEAVVGLAAVLPALHVLGFFPEVCGQGQAAGVQQVAVVPRLVVAVVLGGQAQCARLDAHIDVLGHQHHFLLTLLEQTQCLHYTQNLVVGLALRQAGGQFVVQRHGLEEQMAGGCFVARGIQAQACGQVGILLGIDQCIQRAADLAAIACHFSHALFVGVQLFEHHHGQEDVVLFKAEDAGGVVQQHIGVQHKQAGLAAALFAHRAGCLWFGGASSLAYGLDWLGRGCGRCFVICRRLRLGGCGCCLCCGCVLCALRGLCSLHGGALLSQQHGGGIGGCAGSGIGRRSFFAAAHCCSGGRCGHGRCCRDCCRSWQLIIQ